MTPLHVIYGLTLPQSKILATPMHLTMCNTHTRYRLLHLSTVDALSQAVAYNIAKQQNIRCIASSLKFALVWKYGMEYGRKF